MRRASLNHAYRLVWSHIFNAFVPVPEWAGTKGKRSGGGLAAAVLVAGAVLAPAAMAESWSAGDGDWFDPANWDPTTVPTAADTVSVYTGATVQILSGDSAVADTLAVGASSTIAVEGSLDVGSDLSVIYGSIEVQTGGVLHAGDTLLGNGPTQPATVVVEGTMNVSSFQLFRGQLEVRNGGLLTGTGDIVGDNGPAVLLVTGAGSEWDASAGTVDLDWDADITVADGGRITTPGFFLTRAASSFHMDGGTLRLSANNSRIFNNAFGLPPQITLGAGGGTIDSQAFTIANEHVISGTGELTKIGTGTLTLTGANTYSGGTTVTAGTLAGTTTSLQGDIDNNAAVVFNQTATGTYAGEMSGTGTLTKQGTGNVTLTGDNSYSGGTTISAGTLQIGAGGTTGSISGDVVNNGTLAFNRSNYSSWGGNASGTGALVKSGAGQFVATGDLAHSGGTTINGGTLQIGSGGTTGSLSGNVVVNSGGSLDFARSDGLTFSGNISGAGTVAFRSGAAYTLSGNNSWSGYTYIDGSLLANGGSAIGDSSTLGLEVGATLTLGANETIGALSSVSGSAGSVVLGANTLTAGGNNSSTTFGGVVSGTGGLTKAGTGTLTLSGANTYTGATTVNAGTLTANGGSAIANTSAVTVASGATLSLGASETIGSLAGAGNVSLGANTLTAGGDNSSTTFSGVASGAGGLTKAGTGNLTLSGANTYSGGTTVSAGTLTGSTTSLQGAITNNAAVVLNQGTDGTYAGAMSGTGTLTKQGTGNVTLSGANTYSGGTTVSAGTLSGTTTSLQGAITNNAAVVFNQDTDGTYAGAMSGTGSLTKSGTGSVTLSGMNTYTGTTAVDAGRLVVNGSNAIANTSAVTVATGAQFEMAQTETIGSLAGAGQVLLNPGALTIGDNNTSTTYSGAMSGNGSLIKSGTGTLTLSGTNTFTGITNINAGTLRLEGGSAIGDTRTIAVHTGATLALGASETIGALEGAGSVNLGGNTLTAGGGNGSTTFSGVASGTGGLVKTGTGNLTLSGANTYSGGTTVSAGTLTGTTTSLQGAITNNAAVVLNQGTDGTYAGAISGTGTLTKQGSGNLTLSGANTYSGGTTVSAGTLTGTTASLQGAITNNAAVAFHQATDGSYAGVMSGTGSLTKSGSGMLTLAGTSTVSGATTVAAGTLRVNGALDDSIVTVHDGARLEGTGSIGGLVVVDGATLAPGNSIGTFAVTSDVTFEAGSLFEVEVDADGNGDRLDVTGSVTIDGGTVSVLADETGSWAYTTDYTLLSADGGISGTFDDVVTDLAFLDPTLTYDAGTVLLKLTRNDVEFGGIGRDRNEIAAGDALTAILQAGASPDMAGLIGTMTGLSTASAQRSLQTLAGSSVPNVASIIGTGWRTVQARSADLRAQSGYSGPSAGDATTSLRQWGDVFGSRMTVDSAATVTGFESRLSAAILGVDGMLDGGVQLGASLAYVLDNSEFDLVADEFDTRSVYLTGHAAGDAGDRMTWSVQLGAGAGTIETQRTVIVGATTYLPEGETDTLDLRAYGELAFPLRKDSLGVAPVLGLGAGRTTLEAYTETGGGPVNLSVAEETFDSLSSHAGLRLRLPSDNSSMVVEATATWTHEFGDVTPATTMQFASDPVAAFTVYGAELARDSVQARVRVSGELGAGVSGYIEGNGDWREDARALGAALGFSVDW